MLHQDLPRVELAPLAGWGWWLGPALVAAVGLTAALILLILAFPLAAGAVALLSLIGGAVLALPRSSTAVVQEPINLGPDYSALGAAIGLTREPVALTTAEGSLLIANAAYRERFGGARPPLELASNAEGREALAMARGLACRDGAGCVAGAETDAGTLPVEVERIGARGDLLLWRFPDAAPADALTVAARRLAGGSGARLSAAGVMAAVVDARGKLVAANRAFVDRALPNGAAGGESFTDLVQLGEGDEMRLAAEGESGPALRAVHIPADPDDDAGPGTFLLFDNERPAPGASSNLQTLLDVLPIGLALVDRDGRFLTMNEAFRTAAGIKGAGMPSYPGDLVVKEDKGPVADAVRRNARGPAMSGDLAVRLARQSSDPVALTIAGLRGLGDAAVLLLLKDNCEEAKLKR